MRILYYERNGWINEGQLLGSLLDLVLRAEPLPSDINCPPFFKENVIDLHQLIHAVDCESIAHTPGSEIIPSCSFKPISMIAIRSC
jgi:hypothetical protein